MKSTFDPLSIERRSFEIIREILGPGAIPEAHWPVVARLVHTTGDPDFARLVRIQPGAIKAGIGALASGAGVFTDVRMVESGINRRLLGRFGGKINCLIDSPEAADLAKSDGITRAAAAVRLAAGGLGGQVVAIGNAPTALVELLRLIGSGAPKPALIVGTPVGFVGAADSKEMLAESDLPFITVLGNKGGSPVAAAAVNSLLIQAASGGGLKENE